MRVRHFSNTANNAYHNVMLLSEYANIDSDLPILMFGLRHAISAPAWESVEFDVPSPSWVDDPNWTSYPEAIAVNSRFADLDVPSPVTDEPGDDPSRGIDGLVTRARSRLFGPLRGKRWAKPLIELRDRRALATRPVLIESADVINLIYGSTSLFMSRLPREPRQSVCLEHGTMRWIADGRSDEKAFRDEYRRQIQSAQHVWVTNLDPRTLEVAEDVVPGRWSAFPHPFMPDPRVPFAESPQHRSSLLRETTSSFLILLAASQNWAPDHDKGSNAALTAFADLRSSGVDAGLVAVEWGRQVDEAKDYLSRRGVADHVKWVAPMARLPLQRMMASVDVVWDQFGMEVFGALALRAAEQGAPLVSRGLAASGNQFIGGPVPWRAAGNPEEIVRETSAVFDEIASRGRPAVIADYRDRYRRWLFERHSPRLTAELQRNRYTAILSGNFEPGQAAVDEWPRLADRLLAEKGPES